MDARIVVLPMALVALLLCLWWRLHDPKTDESFANARLPLGARVGGTAREVHDEIMLTDSQSRLKDQYGYAHLGSIDRYGGGEFTLECDLLFEDGMSHQSFHGLVWLSMFGDPEKEDARTSVAVDDGGFRVFVSKFETYGQTPQLDAFKNAVGVARPNVERPWDLHAPATYVPKSIWMLLQVHVDLPQRLVEIRLDEDTFSFKIPTSYHLPREGNAIYLGAKTLMGSGIRLRDVKIHARPKK